MRDLFYCVLVAILTVGGITSCQNSEWYQRQEANDAAAQKRRETPHVVRQADGCKVYAFERGGRDHYFTRCEDGRVETTTTWQECVGAKTRTCADKSETIITEK